MSGLWLFQQNWDAAVVSLKVEITSVGPNHYHHTMLALIFAMLI